MATPDFVSPIYTLHKRNPDRPPTCRSRRLEGNRPLLVSCLETRPQNYQRLAKFEKWLAECIFHTTVLEIARSSRSGLSMSG